MHRVVVAVGRALVGIVIAAVGAVAAPVEVAVPQRLDPVNHPAEQDARSGVRVGDRPLPTEVVEDVRR